MQQALAWKLQISPQSRQEHIKPLMLIAGQLGVSGPPEKTIESVKGFENACFERAQSWAEYQAMIATKMNEIRQKLGMQS